MAEVYNKGNMVDAIHEELQGREDAPASVQNITKKQIDAVISAEKDMIKNAVAEGDKVQYIGFGNFEQRHRSARNGRNPQSGEEMKIEAKNVPAFKPGKAFKDIVAEG